MRETLTGVLETLRSSAFSQIRGSAEIEARWIQEFGPASRDEKLAIAKRRAGGEPLQYLLGSQQFLDLELEVGPGVLIPRPETEFLVTTALEVLLPPQAPPVRLGIEIGLGSGAISLALILALRKREPGFLMLASEVSDDACVFALKNASRVLGEAGGLELVKPLGRQDVLESLTRTLDAHEVSKADFLISNPPYLVASDEMGPDVRAHEPETALFAPDHDPLFFYREIAAGASRVLHPGAPIFVEIPSQRAAEIQSCFEERGWTTELRRDLAGAPRVILARKLAH